MFERYRRAQERRATAPDGERGFTLIELLIVIVVLGVLAGVVVFALGGVTSTSAQAACNSDAKTVETAVQAFEAQSTTGSFPTAIGGTTSATDVTSQAQLVPTYLRAWPTSNLSHYTISVAALGVVDVTPVAAPSTVTNYDTEVAPVAAITTGTTALAVPGTGCYAVK